ncbi:aldo/keto reductase [Streptomyces sp. NPDC007883]|uniref:aldo/keto reductase n=1 Tax=Streptomyces sp. NPDC007883 TaxID=3155116 RepID=UPI003408EBCB
MGLGITFFDTAESYGPFENGRLLARALGHRRDEIVPATELGLDFSEDGRPGPLDGRPEHIRWTVERSLRHLETDVIDLSYMHRLDPGTPVEETMGGMAELVAAGKIRYAGLSEVSAATVRRAHRVHPLTAVQSELSLFGRDPLDNGVKDTLDRLGIGLVAYSPSGRGFLSGAVRSIDDIAPDDSRRSLPRFSPENIAANLTLVDQVRTITEARGATSAQIALAWVGGRAGRRPHPGTRRRAFLAENAAAAGMVLTADEPASLETAVTRDSPSRAPVTRTSSRHRRTAETQRPGPAPGAGPPRSAVTCARVRRVRARRRSWAPRR